MRRPPGFTNPSIGWRETDQVWILRATTDPPVCLADLRRALPDGTTLLQRIVVFQEAYCRSMPEGTEKERRKKAIDALRAGQIRIEPRLRPATRPWALVDASGRPC